MILVPIIAGAAFSMSIYNAVKISRLRRNFQSLARSLGWFKHYDEEMLPGSTTIEQQVEILQKNFRSLGQDMIKGFKEVLVTFEDLPAEAPRRIARKIAK